MTQPPTADPRTPGATAPTPRRADPEGHPPPGADLDAAGPSPSGDGSSPAVGGRLADLVHDAASGLAPAADPGAEERRAAVLTALGDVWDPELGLDVVALGLVYDVRVDGDRVEVDMTLTTPGCPVSEQLPSEAEAAVRAALPGAEVVLRVVWEPPWTPELLSPSALERLGLARG
ncbi:MAG: metal-sulfur cluster assembly factor [Acidimicrobiia bacterium]